MYNKLTPEQQKEYNDLVNSDNEDDKRDAELLLHGKGGSAGGGGTVTPDNPKKDGQHYRDASSGGDEGLSGPHFNVEDIFAGARQNASEDVPIEAPQEKPKMGYASRSDKAYLDKSGKPEVDTKGLPSGVQVMKATTVTPPMKKMPVVAPSMKKPGDIFAPTGNEPEPQETDAHHLPMRTALDKVKAPEYKDKVRQFLQNQ